MATSTEQISSLIGGYTALKQYFEGIRANINSDLNAAANRVGDTRRVFFVDQENGDDTNDGATPQSPLKTLNKASERSVWGGYLGVRLMNDYVVDQDVTFRPGSVQIRSDIQGLMRNISFADYENNGTIQSARLATTQDICSFNLESIRLNSRVTDAISTRRYMFAAHGAVFITLTSSEIAASEGDNLRFLQAGAGGKGFSLINSVASEHMAGLWIEGVAAGTDSFTVRHLAYTNLPTL